MKQLPTIEKLSILSAGGRGKTIGKLSDGRVVLVQGAVPGDEVSIQITKKKSNFFEGKVIRVLNPSPERIQPKCSHFGVCGGCSWQHMRYHYQLHWKEKEVWDAMERIAKCNDFQKLTILPSDEEFYYRNKLEFSFSNQRWLTEQEIQSGNKIEKKNALGFHAPKQWSKVVHIEKCLLQAEPSNKLRNFVFDLAQQKGWSFFDAKTQSGFLRNLMLRNTTHGSWLVALQVGEDNSIAIEELANAIRNHFPNVQTLVVAVNKGANDAWGNLEVKIIFGKGFIRQDLLGLEFEIDAKSFFQTNPKQAEKLYQTALDFADIQPNEVVYDLYTGTGTLAQLAARFASKVVGIELIPEAITAAIKASERNHIQNVDFFAGDMAKIFTDEFLDRNGHPDVIITDPPRDGMHPKVVQQILKISPNRVVYVSCNPQTMARDIALLTSNYKLEKVQPVDMFPQTYHVEAVALLRNLQP